jgi:transketolase
MATRLLQDASVADAPFASALLELAADRPEVAVLAADLSKYTDVLPFATAHPDRFVQLGMAEQNLMGVAGGLAKTGLIPIATTYCVFATRRSYEQVAMALATGGTRSVVVAFLPGITTPFRATHQGTDDLALMRAVPGMTVLDPMDATELAAALPAAVRHSGPVYLRGLRGRVDRLLDPDGYEFTISATHLLRNGPDVGLIGTGLGTAWALEACGVLAAAGIDAAVLHVPTVKPLDSAAVTAFAARFPAVLTVENHSTVGGLGSAVAEALAEAGAGVRLRRLGVPDRWAPAGSVEHIRSVLGLDAAGIAGCVREVLR